MEQPHQATESDKIDIVELLQKIWQDRILVLIMIGIFATMGIIFALSSTNVYSATTTFIPKSQSSDTGSSLSGLASLAGINLGSLSGSDSEIPPSMYPMILNSIPFQKKILAISVVPKGQKTLFKEHLKAQMNFEDSNSFLSLLKKNTLGLPALVKGKLFKKMNALPSYVEIPTIKRLSYEDELLSNYLKEMININVNEKEGFITITYKDQDPHSAAIIALNTQTLLQEEVINFKIKNAQELLTFTESLKDEKKMLLETLQDELATFRDQHQNISSGLFENKLSRLESELAIARSVYEELAKQVEQARIQVRKDTPIFTIIDPVVIPNQRTSPKRTLIVVIYSFVGLIIGIAYALLKEPIRYLANSITSTDTDKTLNP